MHQKMVHNGRRAYNTLMKRRQELQEYLDAQLLRIDQQTPPPNTFDQLELKLSQIERKLLFLKNHHLSHPSNDPSFAHLHHPLKKEESCEAEAKPNRIVRQEFIKVEGEHTPQKLNIASKTLSEGHFQFNSHQRNQPQSKPKKGGSAVKPQKIKQLKDNQKYNSPILKHSLYSTAQKSHKSPSKEPSSSKKGTKSRDWQMTHLRKDIEECLTSNAQLRVKVSQLEGYRNQFYKLKELICKFDRQRKKTK